MAAGAAGTEGIGGWGVGGWGSGGKARSTNWNATASAEATGTGESTANDATSIAIDPIHDNAQSNSVVATPLSKRWTVLFNGPVSYPLVVGKRVFVQAAESQPNVRALDLEIGTSPSTRMAR